MSGLRQSRITAAFFSPILHSVRASSRAAQPGSGIVVPKLAPHPNAAPPPETEPRQVSKPAEVKPGANSVGTFLRVWFKVEVVLAGAPPLRTTTALALGLAFAFEVAFPPVAFPPPMAVALEAEVEFECETPTPIPVAL